MGISLQGLPPKTQVTLQKFDTDGNKIIEGRELSTAANNIAYNNKFKQDFTGDPARAETFLREQLNITTADSSTPAQTEKTPAEELKIETFSITLPDNRKEIIRLSPEETYKTISPEVQEEVKAMIEKVLTDSKLFETLFQTKTAKKVNAETEATTDTISPEVEAEFKAMARYMLVNDPKMFDSLFQTKTVKKVNAETEATTNEVPVAINDTISPEVQAEVKAMIEKMLSSEEIIKEILDSKLFTKEIIKPPMNN